MKQFSALYKQGLYWVVAFTTTSIVLFLLNSLLGQPAIIEFLVVLMLLPPAVVLADLSESGFLATVIGVAIVQTALLTQQSGSLVFDIPFLVLITLALALGQATRHLHTRVFKTVGWDAWPWDQT